MITEVDAPASPIECKFRVSASGYVKVTVDVTELFAQWRADIDKRMVGGREVAATYAAFCEWANDAVSEDVTERAAEDVWFEIESGPDVESLLKFDEFRKLMEPAEPTDAPPKPIKGQLDIFGGEVE